VFEYIRDFRYANNKENYDGIDSLIRGALKPNVLPVTPGSLVLFRGKEAIHRVTPVAGDRVRVMSVLAYNSKPGISLSESARMTFYGRMG
jgi:predicted 2-oxoglutarate/Fe(II)-dependent dioxygenase YbiX